MLYRVPITLSLRTGLVFAVALLALTPRPASAVDRHWTNPAGGFFSDPGNWQGGLVPGSSDKAVFNLPGQSFTVNFSADVTNNSLLLRNGHATFDLDGNIYELARMALSKLIVRAVRSMTRRRVLVNSI